MAGEWDDLAGGYVVDSMKTLGVDELGSIVVATTHRRGFWLWYGNLTAKPERCAPRLYDASPNMIGRGGQKSVTVNGRTFKHFCDSSRRPVVGERIYTPASGGTVWNRRSHCGESSCRLFLKKIWKQQ
jgi:hypothetical protein